jgi:hypothetical protein
MRRLTTPQRTAIDALAHHLSATWEQGTNPPDATLRVGNKRIAVDIATLKPHGVLQPNTPNPRLRFDKVATTLIQRLKANLNRTVPEGSTILLTLTAPIRLPSRTAASIEEKITNLLKVSVPTSVATDLVHGNHIHIHLSTNQPPPSPKLIAFVHNADSHPLPLLNIAHELLTLASDLDRRESNLARNRWLLLLSARDASSLDLYRAVVSQLHLPTDCSKLFIAFADQTVAALSD